MYMKVLLLSLLTLQLVAQQPVQNVRGIIRDKQTRQPLIGATVSVRNISPMIGNITDENGEFLLQNVPVGRINIQVQYVGYEPLTLEDIIHLSTKETYLSLELMQGSISAAEVVIRSSRNAFEAVNDLAVVSTRSFTAEETERIPGGVNDPGRVALSFPGVRVGENDTENQIVVRGNSPFGLLWRLEGIDIPNPNHFAIIGSSGGGITVFSAQLLARSDFSTGGMPAEYGNALSGAFDMHFRHGNVEKREYRAKIGILGLDFATEGPIRQGRSSYLINYRYSTLGLLNSMGFNLVGERVSNDFQDLSFNLAFRNKNNKSVFTVFGIGGLSEEHYYPVENPAERDPSVFNNRDEEIRPANMGATGITWTYLPDTRSYFRVVTALVGSRITKTNDTLNLDNLRYRYNTERYTDTRVVSSVTYNRKLSEKAILKTGIIFNQIFFDFYKRSSPVASRNDITLIQNNVSVEGQGNTQTLQQFAQLHVDFSKKWSANIGYHLLRLTANGTGAAEPRLSVQYQPKTSQRLSLAYGLHSKVLPLMAYYFRDTLGNALNKDLRLIKAHHGILAYHIYTQNKMRISFETYFQRLFNVPVVPDAGNTYWMLNNPSGYPEFQVVSKGKGTNYGLDVALEKLFSNSYFMLATGSLYRSRFQPFNGKSYLSRYSTGFSSSYSFGKEFYLKKGRILQLGGRLLFNGGFRYTPYDPAKSAEKGEYVALKDADFTRQVPPYYRVDTRFAYRFNARKVSGNISLDIQNVMNRINPTSVGYDAATNTTYIQYRGSELVPVLSFQFDF